VTLSEKSRSEFGKFDDPQISQEATVAKTVAATLSDGTRSVLCVVISALRLLNGWIG
jgi:hypothetical protein